MKGFVAYYFYEQGDYMVSRMVVQGLVAIIYTLELVGLLFVTQPKYKPKYYVPVKMTCSVSFVLIAVLFAAVSRHWAYFSMLLMPLLFCAVGDLFMGLYQVARKKRNMVLGLVLFLTAHIGLLVALFRIDASLTWWNLLVPVVALVTFLTVKFKMHLHMGKLTPACVVYSIFLALMLSKSTQYMFLYPGIASCWIGLAGILFFASDFTIIFVYFYKFKSKKAQKAIHYVNLITCFLAIFAFDVSILYFAGM